VSKHRAVGRNVLRKEGAEKVTGRARYIDDIRFENVLYVRTIRSTVPAGAIVDIRYNFDRAGFTIVDHRDVPGKNIVALIDEDQPCLATTHVRHVAEPILLIAHPDREQLTSVDVAIRYDETSPNYDPARSSIAFKTISIDKGTLDAGMAAADVIVEGEYRAGHRKTAASRCTDRCSVPITCIAR
jgi:CO/xanthine dehydrogenase Mo-binding subunit